MPLSDLQFRFRERIATPLALAAFSILMALGIAMGGVTIGLVMLVALVAVVVVVVAFVRPEIGILILMSVSFFLQGLNRFSPVPLGVINEAFVLLLCGSMIIQLARKRELSIPTDGLSVIVFVWAVYNILQVFNPNGSLQAWIHGVRGLVMLSPLFFVVRYATTSARYISTIINIWLFLSFLAAIYGLYQEFAGFLPFERNWLMADPLRFKLFFNWGRFRIFSFLSDPTLFGILMAYSSLLGFIMALETRPIILKCAYFTAAFLMCWVLIYTGTRTAFVVLPAGFGFYCLLTFKKTAIAAMMAGSAVLCVIIFTDIRSLGPLTNNHLSRIRSAFMPSDDLSYQVRMNNQARIQPYIQSHPFGGGVGSSGLFGRKYNPKSQLAEFAPDSGFVRAAVELGWVGLLLYCTFYFMVLQRGIVAYFNLRDKELKAYCAGFASVAFCLILANFPQQSMNQVPTLLIFYIVMGVLGKIDQLEQSKQNESI